MLDWLVASYFSRTDWSWHGQPIASKRYHTTLTTRLYAVLHRPTFLAEFEAFTQLAEGGRKDEVDPLWLASLCMVLCLAINSLDGPVQSPLVKITEAELETLPWQYFEAAQGCLGEPVSVLYHSERSRC